MSEDRDLTHLTGSGEAHMVDVGDKETTLREAVAEAVIAMPADLADKFLRGDLPKGDAPAVVRIAGIQAAKRTAELIPLCHPIPIDSVSIELEATGHGIRALASVRTHGRTGVEMEAMTAVSVAALALYDMVKSVERSVSIETVRLLRKSGGRSGDWERS
jgi:cyclic pyranopterin phosphate synthase